jgi:hypothetical protein
MNSLLLKIIRSEEFEDTVIDPYKLKVYDKIHIENIKHVIYY